MTAVIPSLLESASNRWEIILRELGKCYFLIFPSLQPELGLVGATRESYEM